jgi:two-component system sensor histidine kinase FlrB
MSHAESLSVGELEQAFAVFNRVSAELDTTYRELETKVAGLTQELNRARSARLQELAEKERLAHRLSSLVSALPGGVLIVDAAGIVRDANPQAFQLLGAPLVGEPWLELAARIGGDRNPNARELCSADGRHFSLVSRQLDTQGDRVLLITDVTEVHQLQDQLARKKRLTALGEMAARLAHQIRTPLSSATLYLTQLARPDLPDAEREHICQRLSERLGHMGQQVESMLSFVRGERPLEQRVLLNRVLADLQTAVAPQLAATASTLTVTSVDNSLALMAAKDDLVGALANLVMNAQEAASGPVVLDLWVGALDEERFQLRLRDNGPGIEPQILERIFDPFFTTRAKGTGLGLAVVAMTVANHGGEISARNRAEGGAEFVITLPVAVEKERD